MDGIGKRKKDHVEISLTRPVRFSNKTSGFEKWDFIHSALPELDFDQIDCSSIFYGYRLDFPFLIASMTGGFKHGETVNRTLAHIANKKKVAFALGSLRPLISNNDLLREYKSFRKICSDIPLIGNIGAVNLYREFSESFLDSLMNALQPDALAVHLNPLQEVIQPEGDTKFKGVLRNVEKLVRQFPGKIIVKETGAGIGKTVAQKLKACGVQWVDVAGAGGTSWAAVESFRKNDRQADIPFYEWGIPTCECIEQCSEIEDINLIASGGIENGLDGAKALALGAQLFSSAFPVLKAFDEKGENGVESFLSDLQLQLRRVLFLTSSKNLAELTKAKLKRID